MYLFPQNGEFLKFSRCIYQQHPKNQFLLHFINKFPKNFEKSAQKFSNFEKSAQKFSNFEKCSKNFRDAFGAAETPLFPVFAPPPPW